MVSGADLKQYRESLGLCQHQMAKQLDVCSTSISKIENRSGAATRKTLERYANHAKISPAQFELRYEKKQHNQD